VSKFAGVLIVLTLLFVGCGEADPSSNSTSAQPALERQAKRHQVAMRRAEARQRARAAARRHHREVVARRHRAQVRAEEAERRAAAEAAEAEAAEAAREQGKYWEYVQVLLQNQSSLTVEKLKSFATQVGLDRTRFDAALDSRKFTEMVQTDLDDGIKLGLKGTPSLFINGRRVTAKSYEELKESIDAALKTTKGDK